MSGNVASHTNTGRTITVRLTPGNGIRGIEAALSHADMVGGTLSVAIVPML